MDEDNFWKKFWSNSEHIFSECNKCFYFHECITDDDQNEDCGEYLRKKYKEYLEK